MTKSEAARLITFEESLKNQDEKLDRILIQTQKTNGRVNKLESDEIARNSKKEAYKNVARFFLGSGSIFVLLFIAYEFFVKLI